MKLFKWRIPGTRDKGAEISDLEAQGADLQRALADARKELRQETLRLTEQIDHLGSDLDEAEGKQEFQALQGPIVLPESVDPIPAAAHTRPPVSNQRDQQQDPVAAWKARWPNHCKACGGWGVFRRVSHKPGEIAGHESGEITLRLCDALPSGTCHRCGASDGINVADELSRGCRYCGWDYDDGVPEASEPEKEA
jgi:hypothetical protein